MTEYIYFVKCPDCADEHFSFFDDAKAYALGCLSAKPVITQIEVDRNDFGECVDSNDLGTIWSWEELMPENEEPELTYFTKADLDTYDPDNDPEFLGIDLANDLMPVDEPIAVEPESDALDAVPDNYRKPVPDGMTIKDLVEAMEENEDTVECVCCQELYPKGDCTYDQKHGWICPDCVDKAVECTWCEDLFDKRECRYEVNLGYLCSRCEAAIRSRGETLTFREGNYWDFLDEDISAEETTWLCIFDDQEIGTVTAASEEEALSKMMQEYPELPYGLHDGCFSVAPIEVTTAEESSSSMLEELEDAETYRKRLTLCVECGNNSFDPETGFCLDCGFNLNN
jgi:hypothetical protein